MFIVHHYTAESTEDIYDKGCSLNSSSWWNEKNCPVKEDFFPTIEDAIKGVCEANCFDFDLKNWDYDEYNGEFYTDILVDVNNSEASPYEIDEWKAGRKRLWSCRLAVTVMKQTEPVPISEEDISVILSKKESN